MATKSLRRTGLDDNAPVYMQRAERAKARVAMKQENQMSVTVKTATRALAVGFVLAAAGAVPAWSQGLNTNPYAYQSSGSYYQGNPAQYPAEPYGGR